MSCITCMLSLMTNGACRTLWVWNVYIITTAKCSSSICRITYIYTGPCDPLPYCETRQCESHQNSANATSHCWLRWAKLDRGHSHRHLQLRQLSVSVSILRSFLTAIPRLEAPGFILDIAVININWGNRLLQVYCVNWSILLYSRAICYRSFRHHRHHRPFTRFTRRTPARGGHTRACWCSGKPLNQPT